MIKEETPPIIENVYANEPTKEYIMLPKKQKTGYPGK
tara:strand:+ start:346 stop:456 length:111 start_codon:yes stop_codon:yes gene_type:complete